MESLEWDKPLPAEDNGKALGDKTQSQSVRVRLRDLLVSGAFRPGSKLRASALAEQLGVSRTPIANALAVLASEGLVNYSTNRGYTAVEFKLSDVLDALETRALLLSEVARILAERGIDAESLRNIKTHLSNARDIVDSKHWTKYSEQEWLAENYQLLKHLASSTNNKFLIRAISLTLVIPTHDEIITRFGGNKNRQLNVITDGSTPQYILRTQQDNELLLKMIESRETLRAQQIMRETAMRTRDRISELKSNSHQQK